MMLIYSSVFISKVIGSILIHPSVNRRQQYDDDDDDNLDDVPDVIETRILLTTMTTMR